jgi:hypothetical protein
MNKILAALGQSNRVSQVVVWDLSGWQLKKVLAAMQVSFPELTVMKLLSDDETPPVIHDSFLDGYAPYLEYVELSGITFPGLPKSPYPSWSL